MELFLCIHNHVTKESGVYTTSPQGVRFAESFMVAHSLDSLIANLNTEGIMTRQEKLTADKVFVHVSRPPATDARAVAQYVSELGYEATVLPSADHARVWVFTHTYPLPDAITQTITKNLPTMKAETITQILGYFNETKKELDDLEKEQRRYETMRMVVDAEILSGAAEILQPYLNASTT